MRSGLGGWMAAGGAALVMVWIVGCAPATPDSSALSPAPTATLAEPSPPPAPAATADPTATATEITPQISQALPTHYQGPLREGEHAILGNGAFYYTAISPDGQWLAVVSTTGLRLYRADTFEWQWTNREIFFINKIQWLPDSKALALTEPFRITILNVATGHVIAALYNWDVHPEASPYYDGWESIVMSGDGTSFAATSEYGLIVWDTTSNTYKSLSKPEDGLVSSPVWMSDGRRLAAARDDSTILWDVGSGQPIETIAGTFRAWSPDHHTAILEDATSGHWVWDLKTNAKRYDVNSCATPSPDWSLILDCGPDGLTIRDGPTGETLEVIEAPDDAKTRWSPDSSRIAFQNGDSIEVWDTKAGQKLSTLSNVAVTGSAGPDRQVWQTWTPDSQMLLTHVFEDPAVSLWDVTTGTRQQILPIDAFAAGFVPDHSNWALLTGSSSVTLWDIRTGDLLQGLYGSFPGNLGWSDDSTQLAVRAEGQNNPPVVIWDARTGDALRATRGKSTPGFEYEFSLAQKIAVPPDLTSPDGTRLVTIKGSGFEATTLSFVDTSTQQVINETRVGEGVPISPAFTWSLDGTVFAINRGALYLFDVKSGQMILTTTGESGYHNVAFSPDSKWIAASGYGAVIIWKVPKAP